MALLVEESAHIRAAPETIWKYLSEPQSWRYWWPKCKQAESADRRPLHDGSRFEVTLDAGLFTLTQRPTVEVAQANRALLWVARSMGVTRRHAFYIETGTHGVTVRERCTFEGWGMPFFRFLGLAQRSSEMFRGNLRGLRKIAERS